MFMSQSGRDRLGFTALSFTSDLGGLSLLSYLRAWRVSPRSARDVRCVREEVLAFAPRTRSKGLGVLMLGKRLGPVKWSACFLLAFGIMVVQVTGDKWSVKWGGFRGWIRPLSFRIFREDVT